MRPEPYPFGSPVELCATGVSSSHRAAHRAILGVFIASTVAGCNGIANLSQFDNAHVVSPDASGMDATSASDAEPSEAAHEDGQKTPAAEAGVDGTIEDATSSPEDGGQDATLTEGGGEGGEAMDAGAETEAGEDGGPETEAGCVCSDYGASSTTCYMPCAPVCGAYFGDCNASSTPNPDDGCETYLDSLTSCRTSCGATAAACNPTDVCNAGACGEAHGLAVFTVPLSATAQDQRYADKPSAPWNLAGKTIFVRVYAPGATGGSLYVYLSDESSNTGPSVTVGLAQLASGWMDITLPNIVDQPAVGATGTFSAEQVKQVTIEVEAGGSTSWTNPTVVYVDSVRSSDVTIDDTFDTSIGNMITSSQVTVAGSALTWQDSVSLPVDGGAPDADTNDAGASDAGVRDAAADGD
jgi:hypothetical protein